MSTVNEQAFDDLIEIASVGAGFGQSAVGYDTDQWGNQWEHTDNQSDLELYVLNY